MDLRNLNHIVAQLKDCNDYLDGKVHSPELQSIAKVGAEKAVREYRQQILKALIDNGLNLEGI